MTRHLVDVSKWQVDRTDPLDLAKAKATGFTAVNIALTKGTASHWPAALADAPRRYADQARALGMGLCFYHWLTGAAPGAAQADAFWAALAAVGGPQGVAHQLDCEDSTSPAGEAIWRDYVNATQSRLGRHLINYTGDWWWTAAGRNWNGSSLTPYLWAAPNAGYPGSYPGDTSAAWTAGYGGWSSLAAMQYAVKPLPGTGNCSLTALRDEGVWAALTGEAMATSQNGWTASPDKSAIGIVNPPLAGGVTFPQGVRGGDVLTVFTYVAQRFHATVEPLRAGTCWGYFYKTITGGDTTTLSNHASGTALDFNADRHPQGKAGTFTATQVKAIRAILAYCDGVIRWGGDYSGTKDEMHFEIVKGATAVSTLAKKIQTGGFMTALTDAQQQLMFKNVTQPMTQVDWQYALWRIDAIVNLRDTYAGGPMKGQPVPLTQGLKAIGNALGQVDEAVAAQLQDELAALQSTAEKAANHELDPVATAAALLAGLDYAQMGQAVARALPADQADQFIDELGERLRQRAAAPQG